MDRFSPVPRYVLNAASGPLGPGLSPQNPDRRATAIYGFSTKSNYDNFLRHCGQVELLPYPLIKGYMQGRIDADAEVRLLVALDCESPTQPTLAATTMQSIIVAIEHKAETVEISHTLRFDAAGQAYAFQSRSTNGQASGCESSTP